jgi:hypothetical protein
MIKYNMYNQLQQKVMQSVRTLSVPNDSGDILTDMSSSNGEEELPKRRGKHRRRQKKSGRDGSREPEEFQGLAEPGETQVRIYEIDPFLEGLNSVSRNHEKL